MKSKTCFFVFFQLLIIVSSILIGAFAGFIGFSEFSKPKEVFVEKTVLLSSQEARYIDLDSPYINNLLSESEKYFSWEYRVENQNDFDRAKRFILANLTNEYSRFTTLFQIKIPGKINVILEDEQDKYEKDTEFDYNDKITFAAFARGNHTIEIFIDPSKTLEKFELAHTLSHELVHIFSFTANNNIYNLTPLWFTEGIAESFANPNEEELIFNKIEIKSLSTVSEKIRSSQNKDYIVGYTVAELFVNFLRKKYDDKTVLELVKTSYFKNFDSIFFEKFKKSPDEEFKLFLDTL